jgi:hypothetical protein
MDATSRQGIAFHVGDRSRHSAKLLWAKIPEAHRQLATFCTDQYVGSCTCSVRIIKTGLSEATDVT